VNYEFTSFTDMVFNTEDEEANTSGNTGLAGDLTALNAFRTVMDEEEEHTAVFDMAKTKHTEEAVIHATSMPERVLWKWTNHHLEQVGSLLVENDLFCHSVGSSRFLHRCAVRNWGVAASAACATSRRCCANEECRGTCKKEAADTAETC
jgi:hypothetical protein